MFCKYGVVRSHIPGKILVLAATAEWSQKLAQTIAGAGIRNQFGIQGILQVYADTGGINADIGGSGGKVLPQTEDHVHLSG